MSSSCPLLAWVNARQVLGVKVSCSVFSTVPRRWFEHNEVLMTAAALAPCECTLCTVHADTESRHPGKPSRSSNIADIFSPDYCVSLSRATLTSQGSFTEDGHPGAGLRMEYMKLEQALSLPEAVAKSPLAEAAGLAGRER